MQPLVIDLAHDSQAERRTRDDLLDVRASYSLARYEITSRVQIDDRAALPHSHPVLTLYTDWLDREDLLTTYLHEQMHWWSMECPGAKDGRDEGIYAALGEAHPDLPLDLPEGCGDLLSNLIHLHVCWLELEVSARLLGRRRAVEVIVRKPYYRAIYRRVIEQSAAFAALFAATGMGVPGDASRTE